MIEMLQILTNLQSMLWLVNNFQLALCVCNSSPSFDDDIPFDLLKIGRPETQTYYQVLIDQRDFPSIVSLTQ